MTNGIDADSDQTNVLTEWLAESVKQDASDLHVVAGHPPMMRRHGRLCEIPGQILDGDATRTLLTPLCPTDTLDRFVREKNCDFSLELLIDGHRRRFRVNYFLNAQNMGACFRIIPEEIPAFQWAGFPRGVAERLVRFRNGLVLLTGVAGSGKTTTLAMVINLLNQAGGYRIITVEEPVEYVLPKAANSVVTQREVGVDVTCFADGLKYGLRQDPDVILVGEVRDRETAQMALSAAETGHLVFTTLHTRDAKGAISRYTDLFPQSAQSDIRGQLALALRSVISQHLLPSADPNEKRELALEIMFNNLPIASAIRLGKLESIDNSILTGRADGMVRLDDSVRNLLDDGKISRTTAERFVSDVKWLNRKQLD